MQYTMPFRVSNKRALLLATVVVLTATTFTQNVKFSCSKSHDDDDDDDGILLTTTTQLFWNSTVDIINQQQQQQPTQTQRRPGGLFWCGWGHQPFAERVFPEYAAQFYLKYDQHYARQSSEQDILVYGLHGRCHLFGPRYIINYFPGRVLFVNGEAYGTPVLDLVQPKLMTGRAFQIGMVSNNNNNNNNNNTHPHSHSHSIPAYFGAISNFEKVYNKLANNRQPSSITSSKKHNAIIYTQSNCVRFREEAAVQFAKFLPVHYGGKCKGSIPANDNNNNNNNNQTNNSNNNLLLYPVPNRTQYPSTEAMFQSYKFCMVMENTKKAGYISEKIFNAYYAGCVPIYYGTTEIFDIFNPKSFIYYHDIDNNNNNNNPQAATTISQLVHLSRNATAYDEMLMEPILQEDALEKYFSFSNEIGHGKLKHGIRSMMGIP